MHEVYRLGIRNIRTRRTARFYPVRDIFSSFAHRYLEQYSIGWSSCATWRLAFSSIIILCAQLRVVIYSYVFRRSVRRGDVSWTRSRWVALQSRKSHTVRKGERVSRGWFFFLPRSFSIHLPREWMGSSSTGRCHYQRAPGNIIIIRFLPAPSAHTRAHRQRAPRPSRIMRCSWSAGARRSSAGDVQRARARLRKSPSIPNHYNIVRNTYTRVYRKLNRRRMPYTITI